MKIGQPITRPQKQGHIRSDLVITDDIGRCKRIDQIRRIKDQAIAPGQRLAPEFKGSERTLVSHPEAIDAVIGNIAGSFGEYTRQRK